MRRPTIIVALPLDESAVVCAELEAAGFPTTVASGPADVVEVLGSGAAVGAAIIDAESNMASAIAIDEAIHASRRDIPTLVVAGDNQLETLSEGPGAATNEFVTRPYSADSLRWRIEAMVIRSQVSELAADTTEAMFTGGGIQVAWGTNAPIIAVFSPKGGVGKTTVATNLAAAVQVRLGKQVLLVDADTVTGHVITSLALEGVRTVNDAWRDVPEGGANDAFLDMATNHVSGVKVVALTLSPLHTETLEPEQITTALDIARKGVDLIVVDLHPSYHPLNLAIFSTADTILVPATPDIPAIRAAVQFTDVAGELDIRDRLALVVNRADSGVPVGDIERTVGMDALAQIRSGGMLFVRAANVGRTVIDLFPREKITEDFYRLAERVMRGARVASDAAAAGSTAAATTRAQVPLLGNLFGKRQAEQPEPRTAIPS